MKFGLPAILTFVLDQFLSAFSQAYDYRYFFPWPSKFAYHFILARCAQVKRRFVSDIQTKLPSLLNTILPVDKVCGYCAEENYAGVDTLVYTSMYLKHGQLYFHIGYSVVTKKYRADRKQGAKH